MEARQTSKNRARTLGRRAADVAAAAAPEGLPPLDDPALFLNRELSLLEFQRRVLALARDPDVPLRERLRFLCISTANLDEFFEIRVAGVKEQVAHGLRKLGAAGLSPAKSLSRIGEAARRLVDEQYFVLNSEITPLLEREGIRILKRDDWTEDQTKWVRRHFNAEVLPVLTPVALDPAHPFPRILNKSLNFVVEVAGNDAFGRHIDMAVVQAPRSLPRVLQFPRELAGGHAALVLLSSVVHGNIAKLFPGLVIRGCYQFRVTRNSDLWVDEEEIKDLMIAIKGELSNRRYSDAVRLEVAANCPERVTGFLLESFGLDEGDLYRVDGPVNLHRLSAAYDLVDRPDLKYRAFMPGIPRPLEGQEDMFQALRRGDVLLHHPYQAFYPVVDLLRQAAGDPAVLAIKQTLYRTGADSPIVEALVDAARAGKEVAVVVELRARFDEEDNIRLATRLQDAGARVVYGVVGYKAHSKMLLIVRREGRRIRRYGHLGTGNYHAGTARAYTDFGLLTADREITEDLHRLFTQLTGLGKARRLRKIIQSPFNLHKALLRLIGGELEAARAGSPARIIAKMNSLSDPTMIRALYEASRQGVSIDLIVRGICCLRPGIPGVSDNIRVRSILGRFLEHARVFWFLAGGEQRVYCSSADLMERNLYHRIETCFPILDEHLKARVIHEALELALEDNSQSWLLRPDGTYERCRPGKRKPVAVQQRLLEELASRPGT